MFRDMKFISRWLLTLLLLVSWRVAFSADTNHNFAKWEHEISAYEKADATHPPPKGAVEFVGSSTIRLWQSLAQDFPGQPVCNRGFGGSEVVDATHFADRIIFPYAPRKIFFRSGGNDLWAGKSAEEVFADFQEFAAAVHAKLPATEIDFISWSPSPSRWRQHQAEKKYNSLVADFARDKLWLKYIEAYDISLDADGQPRPELFLADQLHFNRAGYRLLADRVRPFVTAAVPAGN